MPTLESLGLNRLTRDEKLGIVQDLWDSIAADQSHLTTAQREELLRREAEAEQYPDRGISWEEVKAKARRSWPVQ